MTKKTMTIISVFMIIALTSVGFAAWLITGTIDYKSEGSFVANELEDKYFKVEVEFDPTLQDTDTTKGTVAFGRPDQVHAADAWLSYDVENDPVEKLSVTARVKFIPDAGFQKADSENAIEAREMEYYLLEEVKDADGKVTGTQYRTIRVKIDINELFDENGEQTSDFYKWFDWAVQLGYIQYPTAHVVEEGKTYATATNKLSWVKNELDDNGDLQDLTAENDKFKDGYLYIDLEYDMFEIQYADGEDTAKEAWADIKIEFNWGTAVSETTGEGESEVTKYFNPYTFFAKEAYKPENTLDIPYYLKITENEDTKEYAIADTTEVQEEDTNPEDNKTIRYKDLAQRMLDYIRDYLNYDSTNNTGIQFSFELLEGEPVTVTE